MWYGAYVIERSGIGARWRGLSSEERVLSLEWKLADKATRRFLARCAVAWSMTSVEGQESSSALAFADLVYLHASYATRWLCVAE